MNVQFELGCDITEFQQYYEKLQKTLGNLEIMLIEQDPAHLIVWREDGKIVGHALWHEASTDEHRKGSPRDVEDQTILRKLFGGPTDFVELHEVWLKKKYRGKGYGSQFFDFFEELMRSRQHLDIAFYAYNPAALAICRSRGYQEECCLTDAGFEGKVETMSVFRISI